MDIFNRVESSLIKNEKFTAVARVVVNISLCQRTLIKASRDDARQVTYIYPMSSIDTFRMDEVKLLAEALSCESILIAIVNTDCVTSTPVYYKVSPGITQLPHQLSTPISSANHPPHIIK